MAGRILGMGDVLTLVEQAQQKFDQDEMAKQEERLRKGEFTLDDFRNMLGQTKKLGPLNKIMGMIPGMGGMQEMMEPGRRRRRHAAAGRHHRLDDARRAPQSLEARSTRAAAAGSPPGRASSRTKSTSWSSSSTAWPR